MNLRRHEDAKARSILGIMRNPREGRSMTLPVIEADAAQARWVADQLVEQLLTEDLLGIGVPPLHPDAGSIDACAKAKRLFEGAPCFRTVVLNAAFNGYPP